MCYHDRVRLGAYQKGGSSKKVPIEGSHKLHPSLTGDKVTDRGVDGLVACSNAEHLPAELDLGVAHALEAVNSIHHRQDGNGKGLAVGQFLKKQH